MNARRVRCFVCKDLVSPIPCTDEPFAARTLAIGNKRGCICTDCVYELYDEFRNFLEKDEDDYDDTHYEHPRSTTVRSSSTAKKETNSAVTSNPTNPAKNYPCLEYSMESFINLVKKKVYGQDEAVKKTVFTVYQNQFNNLLEDLGHPTEEREHLFLIGPTGVGKTFIAETVLKTMKIPFATTKADALTAAGYIGDNVENILSRLYHVAGRNLEKAQRGVVIIDEFDKKRKTEEKEKDVNGLSVQQELLKILESSTVWIENGKVAFDTSQLTIILCGACVGLDEVVKKRLGKQTIGFKEEKETKFVLATSIEPTDLIAYGFIDEIVGRAPNPTVLKPFSRSTIMDIIYSCLYKANQLFKVKGFELSVDELVLNKIVDRVIAHNTGARDVRKEVSQLLYNAKYQILNSNSGGICEIDEYGNTSIVFTPHNSSKPEFREIPGEAYLQVEY